MSALLATTDCRDEIIFYLTPHHEKPETFEEWDAVMCIERLIKVVGGGKEGKPTPTRTVMQQLDDLYVDPRAVGREPAHTMSATSAIQQAWNQVAEGTKEAYTAEENEAFVEALIHSYFGDTEKSKLAKDFDQSMRAKGTPKTVDEFIVKFKAVCLVKHCSPHTPHKGTYVGSLLLNGTGDNCRQFISLDKHITFQYLEYLTLG